MFFGSTRCLIRLILWDDISEDKTPVYMLDFGVTCVLFFFSAKGIYFVSIVVLEIIFYIFIFFVLTMPIERKPPRIK
jgi:hypothetical protein